MSRFHGSLASVLRSPDQLREAYESLPPHPRHEAQLDDGTIATASLYPKLCRYVDCFPQDSHLLPPPDGHNFLNASRVRLPDGGRFIAAAGPMAPEWYGPDTRPCFWSAVWHNDVRVIVALAPPKMGVGGCADYISDGRFGDVAVEVTKEILILRDSTVQRHLLVRLDGKCKKVIHLQYMKWPNYGVPRESYSLALLGLHVLDVLDKSQSGSLMVHCAGGVGRTASFLSILSLWKRRNALNTEEEVMVSATECVDTLRTQRHPYCVENVVQWKMIFSVLATMCEMI